MKIIPALFIIGAIAGCGVKGDPVPPLPSEIQAKPTPQPSPPLLKRSFPEYDQRNDQDDSN
jgi:hypothetical protein